jgi:diphosphomevalonate decarboxylase
MHTSYQARSQSNINIALIKYWGKTDSSENLPAVGSLSLTLAPWGTTTTVAWQSDLNAHQMILNGQDREDQKVFRLLDEIYAVAQNRLGERSNLPRYAYVDSENSVPTAAGLASSASGMSALVVSAWEAIGLAYDPKHLDLSLIDLVRKGSGSALRSLLGGFVRLEKDGRTLTQIKAPNDFDVAVIVAVMDEGPKEVLSRDGMSLSKETSPYFQAWIDSHGPDLDEAQYAIMRGDLKNLGEVMEHSTAKMHAVAWASRPPLRYLKGESFMVLDQIKKWRKQEGLRAWATMDAGPHIKVFCASSDAEMVEHKLKSLPFVLKTLKLGVGEGSRVISSTFSDIRSLSNTSLKDGD